MKGNPHIFGDQEGQSALVGELFTAQRIAEGFTAYRNLSPADLDRLVDAAREGFDEAALRAELPAQQGGDRGQ